MKKNLITFNEEVKNEISNLEYDNNSAYYILLSLFINLMEIKLSDQQPKYIIITHSPQLVRLIKKLLNNLTIDLQFDIHIKEKLSSSKTNTIRLEFIDINNNFEKKIKWLSFNIKELNSDVKKRSFILGAYLSLGSLSYSTKRSSYHFEIKSHKLKYLEIIQSLLAHFQIQSKILTIKNRYVLYFKKSEYISDILKLFNAINSLYKFEDYRIQKDFSNSLQRLNNLEVSNINKTVQASKNHQLWIKVLKQKQVYDNLSYKAKIFCDIRIEEPEISLSAISVIMKERYNVDVSRTSLSHLIKELQQKYEKIK